MGQMISWPGSDVTRPRRVVLHFCFSVDGWLHVHGRLTRRSTDYNRRGSLAWFSAQGLIVPHFFVRVITEGKFGLLRLRTALGYNLVKYSMCKYHVGAVMWYTLYKKIDFIGVSVYNSDNKEHTSVYPKSPSLVCWFDFNHLFWDKCCTIFTIKNHSFMDEEWAVKCPLWFS